MPLPLPTLDNRTFDEMFDEAVSTIPGSAPAWTDYNFSDPGITLVDLLAWLTELDVYRLDRVPESVYRSFLRLLGVQPRPLQCADTVLVFSSNNSAMTSLPVGLQIGNKDNSAIFQTTDDLHVSAAQLRVVLAGPEGALLDYSLQNQDGNGSYRPFAVQPVPGNSVYLGFDSLLADQSVEVNLYVWAGDPEVDKNTRAELICEWKSELKEAEAVCPKDVMPDVLDWRQHYSARTVWEYYGLPGMWTRLSGVTDETRALTLSGSVRFTAPPPDQQIVGGVNAARASNLYFIRCRLISGSYECAPDIRKIALNTVRARHAADKDGLKYLTCDSTGHARQTFQLQQKPVVPGSSKIQVAAADGTKTQWHEELVWDRLGPHSPAYILSPEDGVISFGDGRVGRVPPVGATITATYQIGGGQDGNLPAHTLTDPPPNKHNSALVPSWDQVSNSLIIDQPFAATGGSDAEPLAETMGRAVRSLAEPSRGVTLADFERLACETPGVPVAQAYALADYDARFPCFPALGSVTVVVMPRCPADRPQPSPEFLEAVAHYLERRRIITCEVHVIAPTYTTVSVAARLNISAGIDSQKLTQLAQSTLAGFFNPLSGGPAKSGWPVGRSVYRAEIMALLQDLPGVIYVDALSLEADEGPRLGCDNLSICPHALVASGRHNITVKVVRGTS